MNTPFGVGDEELARRASLLAHAQPADVIGVCLSVLDTSTSYPDEAHRRPAFGPYEAEVIARALDWDSAGHDAVDILVRLPSGEHRPADLAGVDDLAIGAVGGWMVQLDGQFGTSAERSMSPSAGTFHVYVDVLFRDGACIVAFLEDGEPVERAAVEHEATPEPEPVALAVTPLGYAHVPGTAAWMLGVAKTLEAEQARWHPYRGVVHQNLGTCVRLLRDSVGCALEGIGRVADAKITTEGPF